MITAKVITDFDEFDEHGERGAIYCKEYSTGEEITMMYNKCIGCGNILPLPIGGNDHPRWVIDQKEPLSLSPSVHHVGCWHGWLKNGVWTQC